MNGQYRAGRRKEHSFYTVIRVHTLLLLAEANWQEIFTRDPEFRNHDTGFEVETEPWLSMNLCTKYVVCVPLLRIVDSYYLKEHE